MIPAMLRSRIRPLVRDHAGSALVEFGLLAPVFIGMLIGVVQIGTYMQNYEAVRSLASDASRFAAVEYQKNNDLSTTTMQADIAAMAAASPYFLNSDFLTVDVEAATSDVNGAKKFNLTIDYNAPSFISGIGFNPLTHTYSRPLYVIDNS
jgi:Flp pilus assembly protein TadG